jgi:dTDP-4-dehydrorhamnose reductase
LWLSGFSNGELDFTEDVEVDRCFARQAPNLVINCAAYARVDDAESEPSAAYSANVRGPGIIADWCRNHHAAMIHLSTDFVFDGLKTEPYLETDPVHPLSVYGKSKELGEKEIRKRLKEHLIIRTSWLYGTRGRNFVKTILALAMKNHPLKVVNDQFGCPTSAEDLAGAILRMVLRKDAYNDDTWGTYHYCGRGIVSWFQFAGEILDIVAREGRRKSPGLEPITTAEYPAKAGRPSFSALDCTKIGKAFGVETQPFEISLSRVVRKLLGEFNADQIP